jgi:hypothetical protein
MRLLGILIESLGVSIFVGGIGFALWTLRSNGPGALPDARGLVASSAFVTALLFGLPLWLIGRRERLTRSKNHSCSGERTRESCPCCRYRTLSERAGFDICPVCFWEDDGQDDPEADEVWGGPNGAVSLAEARRNFQQFGASRRDVLSHVRPPLPEEF